MRNTFIEGISNVTRFVSATRQVDARGSREAAWLLASGDPGLGKSGTLTWYAAKEGAIFVRAKAGWTPHWALCDIADVLNVPHASSTEKLFNAVMPIIMLQYHNHGTKLIIDEIDHAARDLRVLETLRDITDAAEMPLIAGGMRGAERMMKRFPQVYSRITDVATFNPISVADVELICRELTDVKIAPDLAAEIQRRSGGSLRIVKNAIARVEHTMRKERGTVTAAIWGGRPLTNDERLVPSVRAA